MTNLNKQNKEKQVRWAKQYMKKNDFSTAVLVELY